MGLDGFYFTCLTKEFGCKLTGARVEDFYIDEQKLMFLQLRAPGRTLRLAFSVLTPPFGMYLAEKPGKRVKDVNALTQTIKKNLQGLFFCGIRQPPFERWVSLEFSAAPGGQPEYSLHGELMGRQNDITLSDAEGIIVTTSRTVHSEARPLYPGGRFIPPPPANKLDPLCLDERLAIILGSGLPAARALVGGVQGVSPLLAAEICHRAGLQPDLPAEGDKYQTLAGTIADLARAALAQDAQPVIMTESGLPKDFYWFPLTGREVLGKFESPSTCLEEFVLWQRIHGLLGGIKETLMGGVKAQLKIQNRKLAKQEEELARAENHEAFRRAGDIILAHLHELNKGAARVTLEDPYTGQEAVLDLEPALTPQQNANSYYRKHTKFKHAAVKVKERIQDTNQQIAWLESLTWSIEDASDPETLAEIREEMTDNGLFRKPGKRARPNKTRDELASYQGPEGARILVGRNNRQNEVLTLRYAKAEHTWLHIRDYPGSHVVICEANPSEGDLEFAAGLAAWFSRARQSAKAEVVYCPVGNVKKIPGAKPGLVQYVNYRSLTVPPSRPPEPIS